MKTKSFKVLRGKQEEKTKFLFSKLADLSLNTIVNIESGGNLNPTIETLTKIANALDVKVDDLINP